MLKLFLNIWMPSERNRRSGNMTSPVILELKNVSKTFSGVTVLKNIDLEIRKGEVHALLGENGAGKSTLIKIVSGYHSMDEGGELRVHGKIIDIKSPKDSIKAHISTIYQELTLCPHLTVAENIVLDKQDTFKGILQRQKEFTQLARKTLDSINNPNIDTKWMVSNLSIAQRQVVEIAKAVASDAEVILMDEPTASISQKDADALFGIILKLKEKGVAIIYISHRIHEIRQIADRVTVLRDGQKIGTLEKSEMSDELIIKMMVGRDLSQMYPKQKVKLGETVLKVENLTTKKFRDVTFEVKRGEIFGMAGLVGAGRTEICDALFGRLPILSGTVELFGKKFIPRNPKDSIDRGIAYITENRKETGLCLPLSVNENINLVNLREKVRFGVVNQKRFVELSNKYKKKLDIRIQTINMLVQKLSGGNQQKVVLGKWLEFTPQIILFDEPTKGIDVGTKAEIYRIMGDLVKQGITIIMVSSELPEILAVTDRILVMREGVMRKIINTAEATSEGIMRLAALN